MHLSCYLEGKQIGKNHERTTDTLTLIPLMAASASPVQLCPIQCPSIAAGWSSNSQQLCLPNMFYTKFETWSHRFLVSQESNVKAASTFLVRANKLTMGTKVEGEPEKIQVMTGKSSWRESRTFLSVLITCVPNKLVIKQN